MHNGLKNQFLKEHCRTASTARIYGIAINQFLNFINGAKISRVNYYNFETYLFKERGNSAQSVKTKLSGVREFYFWLADFGHIDIKEAKRLRLPNSAPNPTGTLTPKEAQAFYYTKINGPCAYVNERDALIFKFLLMFGVRANELINLKWGDLKSDVVKFEIKGGGVTHKKIPPEILKEIKKYKKAYCLKFIGIKNHYPFFASSKKSLLPKKLKYSSFFYMIKRRSVTLVNKKIRPHEFRTTAIIKAYEKTKCIMQTKDFANHKSVETTQRYLHFLKLKDFYLSY